MVTDMTGAALPSARVERLFPKCGISGEFPLIGVLKPRSACANAGIGEIIHVRAVPRLGTGKEHARWSPVSTCFFKELASDDGTKDGWMFILEGTNPSLSPYYLVFLGLMFLIDEIKSLRNKSIAFEVLDADANGSKRYSTTIDGYDHTMGNLLQGIMYDLWIDAGKSEKINYVGYFKRHPLINDITMRIQLVNENDAPLDIFMDGLKHVESRLRDITKDWIDFCGIDKLNFVRVNEFKASTGE
jgi:DNA-directed RNA polymerase subunit L